MSPGRERARGGGAAPTAMDQKDREGDREGEECREGRGEEAMGCLPPAPTRSASSFYPFQPQFNLGNRGSYRNK